MGKIHWRRDSLPIPVFLVLPCGSAGKESTYNVGHLGSIPRLRRSLGAHLRPTRKQATSSVTPQLNPWALVRRAGELPRWTLLQLWASQLSALCSKSLRVLFCLSLGILQARILEWVAFPQGTIFNPGIKPRSPARGKFGVSPMQVWHWSTKWSKAKANTVCPREHTGHSKHTLPITQEKTRQRQGSWLWLRSWTPYCQIQT